MVVTALLSALVLVAMITDVWRRRIYNWLTYPGILIALALNAAGSVWERQSESALVWKPRIGWVGFTESAEAFLLCGGCMVLCYACFRIGGGDVKLIAMMGAFLGVERGIEALLWTIVLSAAAGLVVLVWRVGAMRLLGRAARQAVWSLKIGSWSPLTPEERRQLQVPLYMAPHAAGGAGRGF